jgi:TPP-dependent pyruvate/acetoin dehydrogenase alpha subunit
MLTKLTPTDLINFEEDIAAEFNSANIKAPIHLSNGNEEQIIEQFQNIKENDWVLATWRSHYQCLLKGVPREILKEKIIKRESMFLCFPEYKIFSSPIVTGNLPIAVGIGLALKRDNEDSRVYCFLGDMTAETGSFSECLKYVTNHKLPVKFIIEDNNKSVCTDTRKAWNSNTFSFEHNDSEYLTHYKYESKWPHAGAGTRVNF